MHCFVSRTEWINHDDVQIRANEGEIIITDIPQNDIGLAFGMRHNVSVIDSCDEGR